MRKLVAYRNWEGKMVAMINGKWVVIEKGQLDMFPQMKFDMLFEKEVSIEENN